MNWLRTLLRASVVFWLMVAYAGLYGARRMGLVFVVRKAERPAAVGRLRGEILRRALTRLGPTFIKLGQVLSTRLDLLEREVIDELRKLQDNLPPFPIAEVERIVNEDLGRGIGECFASFESEPVAAASVAQVHRARLPDGTDVAVKVLRPRIRARIERDGRTLVAFARILSIFPKMRHAELVGHLEHFLLGIAEQTDLRIEARNYERFRANFADFEWAIFPRVYREVSGASVLTMQFLEGIKVTDVALDRRATVAERTRTIFLRMLFRDGFLHADMHPGNFVVTRDECIGIFDVGLAKELSRERLDEYVHLNYCLAMGTPDDCVAHFRRYHKYTEGQVDWNELRGDVEVLMGRFRGLSNAEIEVGELLDGMFAVGRKHRIRPVHELTLIIVGVITSEGIGKQLDPNLDTLAALGSFIMPILQERGLI